MYLKKENNKTLIKGILFGILISCIILSLCYLAYDYYMGWKAYEKLKQDFDTRPYLAKNEILNIIKFKLKGDW